MQTLIGQTIPKNGDFYWEGRLLVQGISVDGGIVSGVITFDSITGLKSFVAFTEREAYAYVSYFIQFSFCEIRLFH